MSINKKTAVITGSGARVGRAIALELAQANFHLCLHYNHNETGAKETKTLVESYGGSAKLFQADLSLEVECQNLIEQIKNSINRLDLLVNNASLFAPLPFDQLDLKSWQDMFAVNLQAPFLLSQGLLSYLKQTEGLIINLCDIGAERPLKGYSHYSSSKSGLIGLTRALAVELAPTVRCVGISPGQVAWPPHYSSSQREKLAARIPMQKGGTPQDIATLVRFIALEAQYINGAIIPVDGGLSCRY